MSRLARAVAVRPGEARLVALVAGAFAAVEAGRGMGEVGIATLVVDRLGSGVLPGLYVGLGLVGLVATLGYGVALSTTTSARFFPALLVILATVLGTGWLIALAGIEWALALLWISIYAAGALLLTVLWTVGGLAFDARQAKRLFPLLTSAAIVGSLSGYLAAIVLGRLAGLEALILAEALLLLVAAALLRGLGGRARPRRSPGEAAPGARAALTEGAAYALASPLMRLVAIAYVLLAILLFSLEFPFYSAMEAAHPIESELLTTLALLYAAVTLSAFLIGTLLANRLNARLGVATVALALPIVYLIGFGAWIVAFTAASALIVRYSQQVTQRGVTNAAFGSFFSVLPARRRGQVLAFMDGLPGQVGTMISGALLIATASLAFEQLFLIGIVTAGLCLAVGILIRRAYARSLVQTLREGRAEQVLEGGPGLASLARDERVINELRAATSAERAPERLLAAQLLGQIGALKASPNLRRLCGDDDPEVRRVALQAVVRLEGPRASDVLAAGLTDDSDRVRGAALAALGGTGSTAALEALDREGLVDGLRRDDSPVVRGELAVVLALGGRHEDAEAIIHALVRSRAVADRLAALSALARIGPGIDADLAVGLMADPSPAVRAAAVEAAGAQGQLELRVALAALDDPSREVRVVAANRLRTRSEAVPALLDLLEAAPDRTQEAILSALDGHTADARRRLLTWTDGRVRRAAELRGHASALARSDGLQSAAYLAHVVARRGEAIEARLLQALAILGAPEASGLIRRCLHAPDPEVRAQAIEAIDTLGDPRLARGVVRLLEREPVDGVIGPADFMAAATALSADGDVWVRALALRTLSDYHATGRLAAVGRAANDASPIVRDAIGIVPGEPPMTSELQLVSEIDRMLVLQRVPLFAALDPEDLHRVAAAAAERAWADDDILMSQGEFGSDMVVVVEGSVRVVHSDGGAEHLLRRVGPGEHIGELAVLREAPRAATVIADPPGVRGLVISGEAIRALLTERPEAAMAMLATLAERISQQR